MGAAEIARPDITGEPVAHVVADPDRLRFVFERDHRQHRSKDFLLRDPHFSRSIEIERRLDVIAHAIHGAAAAAGDLGALIAGILGEGQNLLRVARMDERPDLGVGIERMADRDLLHTVGNACGKGIID